jgi:hypothetical protein
MVRAASPGAPSCAAPRAGSSVVEHPTFNRVVVGSTPTRPTNSPPSADPIRRSAMEYDLGVVAKALGDKPRYRRLVGLIGKCRDYGSIWHDLEDALNSLIVLGDVMAREASRRPEDHEESDAIIGQALFTNALVLYCRVHGSHKGRVAFSPAPHDERQKAAHQRITALRNRGVAHYENASGVGDTPWADDRIVYETERDRGRIAYPFARHNYRALDVSDLVELVQIAATEAARRRAIAEGELAAEIEGLSSDAKFLQAVTEAVFDPVSVHGTQEIANALRGGGRLSQFLIADPRTLGREQSKLR